MTGKQFEQLNSQLIEAHKMLRERDRTLSLMATIDRQLSEQQRALSLLVTELKHKRRAVTVLEGMSFEALYYTLLGCREKQLE